MTKSPLINALATALYIASLVFFIQYVVMATVPQETLLIPMAMLSLFVLSAAVTGYLFLYRPVAMFLEGDKHGAVRLFLYTTASFAVITAALVAAMFLSFYQ